MKYLSLFLLCLAQTALAGGWVSGGGELHRDAKNPWWIHNTKSVNYCIQIDHSTFFLAPSRAKKLVEGAFAYWGGEYKGRFPIAYGGDPVHVAQQKFIYQPHCQENTDLRIQFGVLTDEQREFIKTPQNYVGLSIRTDYDTKKLRGKGFIYISPDNGPDRFNTENHYHQSPWRLRNGILLMPVLLHELGHVFGIPHSGRFHPKYFMGKSYLDFMTTKLEAEGIAKEFDLHGPRRYFDFTEDTYTYPFCKPHVLDDEFYENLNIDRNTYRCIGLEFGFGRLRVVAGDWSDDHGWQTREILGGATMVELNKDHGTVPFLYLPKEQEVIGGPKFNIPLLPLAFRVESATYSAMYFSKDGDVAKHLTLTGNLTSGEQWKIFGKDKNGKMVSYYEGGYIIDDN